MGENAGVPADDAFDGNQFSSRMKGDIGLAGILIEREVDRNDSEKIEGKDE